MSPTDAAPLGEDELDLRSYLGVLRRRWKVVVAVSILVVALVVAFSATRERRYRASAELLVRPQLATEALGESGRATPNDAARQLNNEVRLLESGAFLDAVDDAYDGPLDPTDVTATAVSESSDVIEISVVAADAAGAAELANVYVETFVEWRQEQQVEEILGLGDQIQEQIEALDDQIDEARAPLADVEARLAAFPADPALQQERDRVTAEVAVAVAPLERRRTFYREQMEQLELTAELAQANRAKTLTVAEAPDTPVSPKPVRDAALALVLGLVLGTAAAFALEALDDRIRDVGDLERASGGLPILATVPVVGEGHHDRFVATRDDPRSAQAEAYRSLRTAVKFASFDRQVRVIQVTSPSPGEGKTTTVANLAIALAQGGDRVAVACCDLRRPHIHERFGLDLTPGFTNLLLEEATFAECLRVYEPNLVVLPAGTPPPNPSELLSTERVVSVLRALSEEFDVVLVDSTPVLPVTDAQIVSSLADATIVVADSRSTAPKDLQRALQLLRQVHAPVLGTVLNGSAVTGGSRYSYDAERSGQKRRMPWDRRAAQV